MGRVLSSRFPSIMRKFTLLVATLLVIAEGWAQPALPLQVDLDHATFAFDDVQSLLEVYLAFEATSLPFNADSSGSFKARLPLEIKLLRSTEATLEGTPSEPVWQDAFPIAFVVADTSGLVSGQQFISQARAAVPPGEYELQVVIPAATGRQRLELRRDVVVPDFTEEALVGLSDITLASAIEPSTDQQDKFYKNGLIVRPNANQLFGQGLPQLFYYAEAYNVDEIANDAGEYTLFAYVAEANRPQPLQNMQKRVSRPARTPDVLVGSFNLSSLPSGSYFFRVALLNDDNEAMAEQARKFFVYNPDVAREQAVAQEASFETSPYAMMPEKEVKKALEHIETIATERERRRARDIRDLNEQRRFLMEFWTRRDPDPGTPINEFKEEFYQRIQYANERYSASFAEGWKTDRGRTLVKYGLPSSIEPHLYDRDTLPHEIWQFNNIPGEGQALFVFADRSGFGEFELIHSTVAGERKVPNWEEELRR